MFNWWNIGGSPFDPSQLSNMVLWVRGDEVSAAAGEVNTWTDKFSVQDLVKVSDATRPAQVLAQDNSQDVVRFTLSNADILNHATALGITDNFTIYIRFKNNIPTAATAQCVVANIDNGSTFEANKGFQFTVVNSLIRIDYRGTPGNQRKEFAFTDTGYNTIQLKYKANGTSSVRVVKLNGVQKDAVSNLNLCVPATNTLKMGKFGTGSSPMGGDISEVIITADYHDIATEANVISYLQSRYATAFTNTIDLYSDMTWSGWTNLDAISSKKFNGLFPILNGSIYDFFAATVEGDLYYGEQGVNINSWTWTQVVTGLTEIQSCKAFYYNSKWHVLTAHKGDGTIQLHIPQGALDGTYDTYTIRTSQAGIQDIKVQAIDSSGLPQFSFSHQGTAVGNGGLYWMKFTGSDITASGDWTRYEINQHPAAWWHTPIFNVGGQDYICFSARNNAENSGQVPGVYLSALNATRTSTATESTLTSTNKDWLHVRLGNFFGNGVNTDIAAVNKTDGTISLFDSSNAWAETVISLQGGTAIFNLINIGDPWSTGRDSFVLAYVSDKSRVTYWNGTAWSDKGGDMATTGDHPHDNEGYLLDLDNSGTVRLIVDDNENTPLFGHIKRGTFGKALTAKTYY